MFLSDKLTIDAQRRTKDGYAVLTAKVARAGNVQLYAGSEVGKPEMSVVRVYRPADEVFSADTMRSFAHKPVTVGHPDRHVTADNWQGIAKGWTDGEVLKEGEFVRVSMLLADAEAIKAVESGTRELSMGYDCSLSWEDGVSPLGEAYDAIQRGIRSNHVAIVAAAWGGPELRIGDSARKTLSTMTDAEKQAMRDSVYGMPYDKAAELPLFDDVRGGTISGMPAEQYFALSYGASPATPTDDAVKAAAAYDQMVHDMANAHKQG
jgi:hypothetical protein